MSGDVTVISGPTAVGKGTVVQALRELHPELWVSVSATTRSPRPGEVEGQHYLFVSDEEFDELIASGGLLEWALVHGTDRYGTPAAPVRAAVAAGRRVILEIEVQGARQVKANLPEVRTVFIAPPSWDVLRERLVGRGTETPEQMARRLRTAEDEIAVSREFDHVVVNDDLGTAVGQLVELLGL
ncbi:Guanylate kinase [Propionicimonas sp. T2.31MG-18]|uniref:guanylate kinase n=1 Tax=Propionicimonas sp. T2.31MG-18 TaxID=3157620 RepID=UPI0035EEB260